MKYSRQSRIQHKFTGGIQVELVMILVSLLMILAQGCKPTEKNYRSAYDVAREKRDRDRASREELQKDMGLQSAGEMEQGDGEATISVIDGNKVWTRHLNFQRKDSVLMYAVSVGTFGMGINARALAADLQASGWRESKVAEGGGRSFVIIGSSNKTEDAMQLLLEFDKQHERWQYVGQPGVMLIIGGSK